MLTACSSEPSSAGTIGAAGFGAGGATVAGGTNSGAGGGSAGVTAGGGSAGLGGASLQGGGSGGGLGNPGDGGSNAGMAGGGLAAGGTGGSAGMGGMAGDPNVGGSDSGAQTARPINQPYAGNGYWEYLPPHYGNGFKRPLLVFWAGVGENGDGSLDGLKVITDRHGPPMLIAKNEWPADRPFVVLSPQHGTQVDRPSPDEVHAFIAFALGKYDVDPDRVYITGLSSGARGCYGYLGQYKGQQVAAAVLIAGDSSVAYDAGGCDVVNQVALWAFHGDQDSEVPYADDTAGMNNFLKCPQPRKDVQYTVYPGVGHVDSWPQTYDLSAGHDIYAWMLQQKR